MADIWNIYYNHWARESNEKKKKIFVQKSMEKIIRSLYRSWLYTIPDRSEPSYQKMGSMVKKRIEYLGQPENETKRFEQLSALARILVPSHTPPNVSKRFFGLDNPLSYMDPNTYRLFVNLTQTMDNRDVRRDNILNYLDENGNKLRCHQLDAVLCLF